MADEVTPKFNLDQALQPAGKKGLRRLPRLVASSLALVWRAARRWFLLSAGLQVVAAAGLAAQVLLARELLQGVLGSRDGVGFGSVLMPLIALTLVTALVSFATLARVEQERVLSELVGRYAINQVLDVATSIDLLAYERPAFHNRLQRAAVNAHARPGQMASGTLGLLSSGLAIGAIAAALLVLQPMFLLLVLLTYVPAWLATTRASKASHAFSVEQTERDRRRQYLFMLLTGKDEAKEVQSFGLGGFLRARHDRLYDERIRDLGQLMKRRLRLGLVGNLVTSLLTGATVAVLVWMVTAGRIDVSSAGAAAGAIILLGQRLRTLSSSAGSLYECSLFLEDFTTFVEWKPAIAASRPTASAPAGFSTVAVEDVSFAYPGRDERALHNVSMNIRRGEVVALVGENGSGKTTLAKLLAGLYAPDAGVITWDGVSLATWDPDTLRRSIAVIFQDFVRYWLTVRENIGMGRHERYDDIEAIITAAEQAGAHGYLAALDNGYETQLGPQFLGGTDLSIGQWQRVALARAFFRDAPFIILDEPTAALDPRAESELFERIRALFSDRTVLLISHRFSSVRSADRIYVLEAGRVVENGTHGELMMADGLYANLFRLQASAYLDDVRT